MDILTFLVDKLKAITEGWSTTQYILLAGGVTVTIYAMLRAYHAVKIGSYKLWSMVAKLGLSIVVLAFAYPYAVDLYNSAEQLTGSPLYGILAILAGVFFGYNTVKMLLSKPKSA